jgi:uncharacterized protein
MPQNRGLRRGVLNTALLARSCRAQRFSFDSSRYLNHCSNVLTIIRIIGRPNIRPAKGRKDRGISPWRVLRFELGMAYSVGRDVPIDLVSAHKWFNLAAVKGNREAVRLRREIADQMSESEIAAAQRAARDWLKAGAAAPAAALAA